MALLDKILSTDTISFTDQMLVETSFDSDLVSVSDQVFASMIFGPVVSDSVATSDTVQTGFVRYANLQDAVSISESLALAADYRVSCSDAVPLTDVIHTWKHDDGRFQVDLQGDADLRAVLLKQGVPSGRVVVPPPKKQTPVNIPVPPTQHFVVNPSPPRRGEG